MANGVLRPDGRIRVRSGTSARRQAATPADADLQAAARERRDRAIFLFFAVEAASICCLQCFALPLGGDAVVAVAMPLMLVGLAVLAAFVRPVFDPRRLGLYALLVVSIGASTGFFADRFSIPSLALFVLLYAPFALAFPTSEANYRRCMNFFSTLMVGLACVEFAQHAIQLVAGPSWWPNLYRLLPKSILIPEFNYLQPISWGSHFNKPQAVVFLETSFLSQYLALAIAVEVALFQRVWRLALLAAALLATFAGTGPFLLALTLPVLLGRMKIGNMALIVLALVVVFLVAVEAGWFAAIAARVTEYQYSGTSANRRFIEPITRMMTFATASGSIYSGIGAGQIEKINSYQFWPFAKAVIEYGYITGVALYAYFLYVMFNRAPSRRLAFTLVVWFSLEGALLTAVNPLTCVLLSSVLLVERERRPRTARVAAGAPLAPA